MKSGWQKYKFPVLPTFRLRTTKEEKCPSVICFVLKFIIIINTAGRRVFCRHETSVYSIFI
jgi:hypothetical protein